MDSVNEPFTLSAARTRALDRMAADFVRVFHDRFVALVAYAPADAVGFATTITAADLAALGSLAEAWHRDGLATPLVLTPDEFRRSLDAFPLEYSAILARHVLIAGRDPFTGMSVDPQDVRRACEVQAKGHLIHLRQGWLDASGHEERLADLIADSAAPLRVLLTELARLDSSGDGGDPAAWAQTYAGLDAALIRAVLALEQDPDRAGELVPRLPEYLAAAERLWALADTWRRSC
jgi:hypothetical protein